MEDIIIGVFALDGPARHLTVTSHQPPGSLYQQRRLPRRRATGHGSPAR